MSERVERLHAQMTELSLKDLLLLAAQAIDMGLDDRRLDLILTYVSAALAERKRKVKP